jgi:predicted small lipoprotein YifL
MKTLSKAALLALLSLSFAGCGGGGGGFVPTSGTDVVHRADSGGAMTGDDSGGAMTGDNRGGTPSGGDVVRRIHHPHRT